jgi:hypothetical protein
MFDKLLGLYRKKAEPRPDLVFGRYSDNSKTVHQNSRRTDADNFFRDKAECIGTTDKQRLSGNFSGMTMTVETI